jgi:hypothetical protein
MVQQHLTPARKDDSIKNTSAKTAPIQNVPSDPSAGQSRFPAYTEYAVLSEKAETLPDIIHLPFEDTAVDVILDGWEDQWFADAEIDVQKWGKLNETKIDFVYTCEIHPSNNFFHGCINTNSRRG